MSGFQIKETSIGDRYNIEIEPFDEISMRDLLSRQGGVYSTLENNSLEHTDSIKKIQVVFLHDLNDKTVNYFYALETIRTASGEEIENIVPLRPSEVIELSKVLVEENVLSKMTTRVQKNEMRTIYINNTSMGCEEEWGIFCTDAPKEIIKEALVHEWRDGDSFVSYLIDCGYDFETIADGGLGDDKDEYIDWINGIEESYDVADFIPDELEIEEEIDKD